MGTSGGGFVVSGGPSNPIATITTTSNHVLLPGNYVQLFGVGDPTYAAALNGAVVPVLTTPTTTTFTVSATYGGQTMPNGDYSAGYAQQPWFVSSMNQVTDESWLHWLNQYMDGYFTVVASYAQGGTVSTIGVALLPKIEAGPKAEYAFIQYCTNDVNAGTPGPDKCLANIETIVAAVEAMGMVPILCTPPALGDPAATPTDPASTLKAQQLQTILSGEQALAQNDPNLILLDTYSATVTPSDPAGHFLPNYAPVDGIHPSSYGEARLARGLASYLATLLPVTDTLPGSPDASGTNFLPNAAMTGTNGGVTSTATNEVDGTTPTGWLARGFGGTAANPLAIGISANNTHAGTPGLTVDITAQSGTSGQGFIVSTNGPGSGAGFPGQLAPGSWYQCGFQLGALTDLTNINLTGQVFLNYGSGNTPSVYFMMNNSFRYENGTPLAAGESLQYISQPFYIAQPATAAYFFINAVLTGDAGGQQLSLGRPFCRSVASPYD